MLTNATTDKIGESEPLMVQNTVVYSSAKEMDIEMYNINRLHEISLEHNEVVQYTLQTLNKSILISFFIAFNYMIRINMLVLYCKSFNDYPGSEYVGIAFAASFTITSIICVVIGYIGVKLLTAVC